MGGPALDTELLRRVAAEMGFELPPGAVRAFEQYAGELVAWNARVNLTRLTRPDEIAVGHILDSLVCLRGLPAESRRLRCADVGAGAGLPGLALKIVRPEWSLTLIEATARKVAFLEHVVRLLGLEQVRVVGDRAETVGQDREHRERYDVALARAVAALPVLAELLLPLLRRGGRMLALKGADVAAELNAMEPALEVLGGRLAEVQPYRLPGLAADRHLVVVEKVAPTPPRYPRRPGVPARRPLAAR